MSKTIIPAQLIASIYQYMLTRPMGEVRQMVEGLEAIINAENAAQVGKGNGVGADDALGLDPTGMPNVVPGQQDG